MQDLESEAFSEDTGELCGLGQAMENRILSFLICEWESLRSQGSWGDAVRKPTWRAAHTRAVRDEGVAAGSQALNTWLKLGFCRRESHWVISSGRVHFKAQHLGDKE